MRFEIRASNRIYESIIIIATNNLTLISVANLNNCAEVSKSV